MGDRYFGTLTAVVEGEQAGRFGFTSSLTAQMLKTLLPQLQPHLYPGPPTPPSASAKPTPEPAAAPAPVPAPTPARPRAPVKETPDGSTSQADPTVKQPVNQGGFPEDLEPNVVLPVPVAPPARPEPAVPSP
jgi:hypothetical protein